MASAGSVASSYLSTRGPPGRPNLSTGSVPRSSTLGNLPPTIRTHPDAESNSRIVHTYVVRQWENGFHNQMQEGQLLFSTRRHYEDDAVGLSGGNGTQSTIVTLFQLNHIARQGYRQAKHDLIRLRRDHNDLQQMSIFDMNDAMDDRNNVPEHLLATRDYFDNMEHEQRVNYMAQLKERMLNDEMDVLLRSSYQEWFDQWDMDHAPRTALWLKAHELKGEKVFRYTTQSGFLDYFNFLGVFQNSQKGSTPMIYQNATRQYDHADQASIINVIMAKKAPIINVWGSEKNVQPRTPLFLNLRRRQEGKGKYSHFEVVPFADVEYEGYTPPLNELAYRDDTGTWQQGHAWYVGWMDEFGRESPPEQLRQQAIGNTTSPAQAYEAMGVLARTSKGTAQIGVH